MFGFATFYSLQLTKELVLLTDINKIIRHFLWFLISSSGLFVFIYYNLKRQNLLSFFENWEKFEINYFNMPEIDKVDNSVKKKPLVSLLYISYLFMKKY